MLKKAIKNNPFIYDISCKIRNSLSKALVKKKVIMFHFGRSGSTVLGNMLDKHPNIRWAGEIFSESGLENAPKEISPSQWIKKHRYNTLKSVFGLETKYLSFQQLGNSPINLSIEEYLELVESLGFHHFIMLNRRNILRTLISTQIAFQNGIWHSKEQGKLVKLTLDFNNPMPLMAFLEQVTNEYENMQKLLLQKNHLNLTYEEDILVNPYFAYSKVCSFLEYKPQAIQPDLKKTNPYSVKETLTNFAEVEKTLINTPYEWMLHE